MKDIMYVLTAAECKSISRAAEILYISQPALSRYISKLERELGLALFERSGVFFVKRFSLKKASEFPVFSKGFSLL